VRVVGAFGDDGRYAGGGGGRVRAGEEVVDVWLGGRLLGEMVAEGGCGRRRMLVSAVSEGGK
jgi:hypothetical protein